MISIRYNKTIITSFSQFYFTGPLFESYDPKVRLDASDAVFVDVIHSNGDSLLMGGLGSWEAIGHLDFYVSQTNTRIACLLKISFLLLITRF